jgi:hypothetical protein
VLSIHTTKSNEKKTEGMAHGMLPIILVPNTMQFVGLEKISGKSVALKTILQSQWPNTRYTMQFVGLEKISGISVASVDLGQKPCAASGCETGLVCVCVCVCVLH